MIGILAIWAACFFWVIVFFEINREEYGEKIIEYYDHGIVFILLILLAPLAFCFAAYKTHSESV